MPHNFWMVICNAENYQITRDLGFTVQGLKAQHRRKVQRIGAGDRILYYVSHARRFTATATATTSFFEDDTPIWEKEGCADWPYRIQIKPEIVLEDSQYIDANLLAPRLDYVRRWPPENWYMAFQGNLHLLPKSDFLLIEEEMKKLKFGRDYKRSAAFQAPRTSRKKTGSGNRGRRGRGKGQAPVAPTNPPGNNAARRGHPQRLEVPTSEAPSMSSGPTGSGPAG